MSERVADYVAMQAESLLWPEDARRIRVLLENSATEDAITLYFERVGERWEREYLHRTGAGEDRGAGGWTAPGNGAA